MTSVFPSCGTNSSLVPPSSIVAGIGCSSTASAGEIIDLVKQSFEEAGYSLSELVALCSHARKARHEGLAQAAREFGVPLVLLDDLPPAAPNPSPRVLAAIGLPSIAEATALSAGPLVLQKRRSVHATCALAVAVQPSFSAAMAAGMSAASGADS